MNDDIDLRSLKIMALTWNMQGKTPSLQQLDALFQKDNIHHDMYVLAS